jgi:hypothetical protein
LNCKECDKPFIPKSSRQKFCYPSCAKRYHNKSVIITERRCKLSDKIFHVKHNYRKQKFCSISCSRQYAIKYPEEVRILLEKTCEECYKLFQSKRIEQRFCCNICVSRYCGRARTKLLERTCAECNNMFKPINSTVTMDNAKEPITLKSKTIPISKKCKYCKQVKLLSEFEFDVSLPTKDHRAVTCNTCMKKFEVEEGIRLIVLRANFWKLLLPSSIQYWLYQRMVC